MNLKEHQVYYEMLAVFSLERVYLPMICQTFFLIQQLMRGLLGLPLWSLPFG